LKCNIIVFGLKGFEKWDYTWYTVTPTPDVCRPLQAFNIFQVYQYFTIYRRYFLLKFDQFSQEKAFRSKSKDWLAQE
jgi:hypothetical protein